MPIQFHSLVNRGLSKFKGKEKIITSSPKSTKSMDEDDVFEECGNTTTPLSAIADAFEDLSESINNNDLHLKPFCDACSPVAVLFGCLGFAFRFAEMEFVSKIHDLEKASTKCGTINDVLDYDVENDTVKTQGSHSRNLRRVRQGLDLIRAIFENFLTSQADSLKEAASTAYAEVCAPYHTWAVRTAVYAGMCTLPTREQLVVALNETHESAEKEMRRYIDASLPVIKYIDEQYIARNIALDW